MVATAGTSGPASAPARGFATGRSSGREPSSSCRREISRRRGPGHNSKTLPDLRLAPPPPDVGQARPKKGERRRQAVRARAHLRSTGSDAHAGSTPPGVERDAGKQLPTPLKALAHVSGVGSADSGRRRGHSGAVLPTLRARVASGGNVGCRRDLLDDGVTLVLLDDALGLRNVVAGEDDEARPVRAHALAELWR